MNAFYFCQNRTIIPGCFPNLSVHFSFQLNSELINNAKKPKLRNYQHVCITLFIFLTGSAC